jgi:hypothetical protein
MADEERGVGLRMSQATSFELHYRISELAAPWRLGRETVRKLLSGEPGVVILTHGAKQKHGRVLDSRIGRYAPA